MPAGAQGPAASAQVPAVAAHGPAVSAHGPALEARSPATATGGFFTPSAALPSGGATGKATVPAANVEPAPADYTPMYGHTSEYQAAPGHPSVPPSRYAAEPAPYGYSDYAAAPPHDYTAAPPHDYTGENR
jgi:hypothetical protein